MSRLMLTKYLLDITIPKTGFVSKEKLMKSVNTLISSEYKVAINDKDFPVQTTIKFDPNFLKTNPTEYVFYSVPTGTEGSCGLTIVPYPPQIELKTHIGGDLTDIGINHPGIIERIRDMVTRFVSLVKVPEKRSEKQPMYMCDMGPKKQLTITIPEISLISTEKLKELVNAHISYHYKVPVKDKKFPVSTKIVTYADLHTDMEIKPFVVPKMDGGTETVDVHFPPQTVMDYCIDENLKMDDMIIDQIDKLVKRFLTISIVEPDDRSKPRAHGQNYNIIVQSEGCKDLTELDVIISGHGFPKL